MANLDLQGVERENFIRRVIINLDSYQATAAAAVIGPARKFPKAVVQSGYAMLLTQTSGTTTVAIKRASGTAAAVTVGTVSLTGAADVTGTAGPKKVAITFTDTAVGEDDVLYAEVTAAGTGAVQLSVHVEAARDFS